MRVHMIARAEHLASHIDPIWNHLGDLRGDRIVDEYAQAPQHWGRNDVVMVASYLDIFCAGGRKTVYVEHGAGQSYKNLTGGGADYYHGGNHPDSVIGYLGPRQDVIDSWGRPGYACGAPVCDGFELFSPEKVAAITFHHDPSVARTAPEAGTAFDHYAPDMGRIITALQDQGYEVLGHRHPRFNHLRGYWEREHGIREATVGEVRTRAQLLIFDNTSLAYELMYLWRDVIALNAPWFRRDVEHGLRFWEHAPSVQANSPDELIEIINSDTSLSFNDLAIPEYVYGAAHSDGLDGQRAAAWLSGFVSTL